jgi:hypothetical protein
LIARADKSEQKAKSMLILIERAPQEMQTVEG